MVDAIARVAVGFHVARTAQLLLSSVALASRFGEPADRATPTTIDPAGATKAKVSTSPVRSITPLARIVAAGVRRAAEAQVLPKSSARYGTKDDTSARSSSLLLTLAYSPLLHWTRFW